MTQTFQEALITVLLTANTHNVDDVSALANIWNSDLKDGVRLITGPSLTAGVLRARFTINWNIDRGKNPDGSDRENDVHLTNAEKRSARGG